MARLSAVDLRASCLFLMQAEADESDEPFSRTVLGLLARLVPADLVEYFEIRRSDRHGIAYTTSDEQPSTATIDQAFELFRSQNPIGAFRWTPAYGPLRLSTTLKRSRLERLDWYQEFLRPMRIRDQLKVWLWSSPASAACVSFDRSTSDFTERDVTVLTVLQDHLAARRAATTMQKRSADARGDARLTVREAQVLTWVLAGKRNREVAEVLFISPATVRKHLENAYAKLGARSRAEALAAVLRSEPRGPSSP